jgi:hypothetical protein
MLEISQDLKHCGIVNGEGFENFALVCKWDKRFFLYIESFTAVGQAISASTS